MWTREQLKTNGKQLFMRNYWPCVGVAFMMGIVSSLGSMVSTGRGSEWTTTSTTRYYGHESVTHSFMHRVPVPVLTVTAVIAVLGLLVMLLSVFVGNVLIVGGTRFFILNRTERVNAGTILDGFRSGHYGNLVLTMFLRDLFVFLWMLLLIVPGIIKSLEYLMVPYILAENPGMDRKEVFALSKRMMDGQKWNAFVLQLSFLGWILLSIITCNLVGIFYVSPYMYATETELYAYNKIKAYNEGYIR